MESTSHKLRTSLLGLFCALLAPGLLISQDSKTPDQTASDNLQQTERTESAEALFALGASFYTDQNWEQAAEHFRELIESHPYDRRIPKTTFYLAESLVQMNENQEASTLFRRYLRSSSQPAFKVRAIFRLAECQYLDHQFREARSMFLEFMRDHGGHPLAEFALPYLGELHHRFGDADKSRAAYQEALQRFPNSGLAYKCRLGLAHALAQLGEVDEAIRQYRYVAEQESHPLADDARYALAKTLADQGDWNRAESQCRQLLDRWPDSQWVDEASYLIAKCQMANRDWSSSWQSLSELVEKQLSEPLRVRTLLDAAVVAIRLEKLEEAQSLVDRAKDLDLDEKALEFAKVVGIDIAHRQNNLQDLQQRVVEFESRFPDSIHITRCIEPLARLLYDRGEYAQAAARYEQLIARVTIHKDLVGNLPVWRYLLGLSRIGTGEYELALQHLKKIQTSSRDHAFQAATAYAIGTAYSALEKPHQAIPHFRRYLSRLPDGPDAVRCRADLAAALGSTGQLAQAIEILEPITQRHPNDPNVLAACEVIAERALQAGRPKIAQTHFTKMADSDQPKYSARGVTGLLWAIDASQLTAERLSELTQQDVDPQLVVEAVLSKAQGLQAKQRHVRAIELLEYLIESHPESPMVDEARFRLAVSLQRRGEAQDASRAVELLESLLKHRPEQEWVDLAYYELAWARNDTGDHGGAREAFETIYQDFPESDYRVDSCYRAAMLARQSGDVQGCARQLRQVLRWDPDHHLAAYAHYSLGEMASENEQWTTASKHFRRAIQSTKDPDLVNPARYWLAESLYQAKEFDEAEALFAEIQTTEFEKPEIQPAITLRLAQTAAHREDWSAVEEIVARRGSSNPSNQYQLDYLMGRVHMSRAEFDRARQRFRQVLNSAEGKGTRTAAMSQWMIGECWFHQQEYKQALRAYLLVDSLHDFDQWRGLALLQAAKCHARLGDNDTAMRTCQRLLETLPNTSHAQDAKRLLSELKTAARGNSNRHIPARYRKEDEK